MGRLRKRDEWKKGKGIQRGRIGQGRERGKVRRGGDREGVGHGRESATDYRLFE